jgi:hypothetical protein
MAQQLQVGQGFEASRLHSAASQSVELLCTIDQPVTETSDNTQHSHQISMPPGRIRTRIPNKREAADLRHMPERAEFQIFGIEWRALSMTFHTSENFKGLWGSKSVLFNVYRKFKHGVKRPELTYLFLVPRSRKMV